MRLKIVKVLLVIALVANVIVWHRIWKLFSGPGSALITTPVTSTTETSQRFHRWLVHQITIVIRQFEPSENDVASTVESVISAFPRIPVLIVCDELPYPPLGIDFRNETTRNIKLVNLQLRFNKTLEERNPLFYIRTKFVLFLPDATRLSAKLISKEMFHQVSKLGAIAVPIGKSQLTCVGMELNVKKWTLRMLNNQGSECDSIAGRHATMIDAKTLRKLSDPFILPFPEALYLQTTAVGKKIHLIKEHHFNEGKVLFRNHQAQWKVQQLYQNRERRMFVKLGIKKVTRASGAVEWYGCSRETARCFGSVVNGIPSYIYQNRYTPPCCLMGLRRVAHHVFDKLEEAGVRFWIESASLLGAVRNGDILPWGHEVDIGLHHEDISKTPWLVRAKAKPFTDNQGFIWEKATEGEFFRVQYSKTNHLHVNLLPFHAQNGTMVKDAWFFKNKNFPEHFLHPMSTIQFAGRQVPCPNNVRDLLEMKYHKGVIENLKDLENV